MKILHVSYYDLKGGAGLAAYRLCKAQRQLGIDARMLVAEKYSDALWVIPVPEKKLKMMKFLQRAERFINVLFSDKKNFMPRSLNFFSLNVIQQIIDEKPDIVHLHWVNGQMLSCKEIAAIPFLTVWTFHDTWAYCGSEHHHLHNDKRFADGYSGLTLETIIWKIKQHLWKNLNTVIIGPSAWITAEVAESALFKNNNCRHIFNGIDLHDFSPILKPEAKKYWNIPAEKQVITIGAFSFNDKNKGGRLFRDTLAEFPDAVVLAIGGDVPEKLHKNLIATGKIDSPDILSKAYSAGDVFLSCALYDNLPNMLLEAVACGTPCVAVDTGGVREILCGKNGKTAPPDCKILAENIRYVLEHQENFSPSAALFDIKSSVQLYTEIYNKLIQKRLDSK